MASVAAAALGDHDHDGGDDDDDDLGRMVIFSRQRPRRGD
jgi:hypothetical protein